MTSTNCMGERAAARMAERSLCRRCPTGEGGPRISGETGCAVKPETFGFDTWYESWIDRPTSRMAAPDVTTAQATPPQPAQRQPMPAEQSAALAEFARACKAAARAVSLYPGAHPAIGRSLTRLVVGGRRLSGADGDASLVVHPDHARHRRPGARRGPMRPSASSPTLLHGRLIGALRVSAGADADDWRALLLLLARAARRPDRRGRHRQGLGGHRAAATSTSRKSTTPRCCASARAATSARLGPRPRLLPQGRVGRRSTTSVIDSLLDALGDARTLRRAARPPATTRRSRGLEPSAPGSARSCSCCARRSRPSRQRKPGDAGRRCSTPWPTPAPHLSPEMLLGLLAEPRVAASPRTPPIATGVLDRMTTARSRRSSPESVTLGAGRLGAAGAGVRGARPGRRRGRGRCSTLAHGRGRGRPNSAQDPRFDELWQSARRHAATYSDKGFVSADYARELTAARDAGRRGRAPVGRPARADRGVARHGERAARCSELDLLLTLDLMRIENEPDSWDGDGRRSRCAKSSGGR